MYSEYVDCEKDWLLMIQPQDSSRREFLDDLRPYEEQCQHTIDMFEDVKNVDTAKTKFTHIGDYDETSLYWSEIVSNDKPEWYKDFRYYTIKDEVISSYIEIKLNKPYKFTTIGCLAHPKYIKDVWKFVNDVLSGICPIADDRILFLQNLVKNNKGEIFMCAEQFAISLRIPPADSIKYINKVIEEGKMFKFVLRSKN